MQSGNCQKTNFLPIHPYAIEGYCEKCAGKSNIGNNKAEKFFEMEDDEENENGITNNISSILLKIMASFSKEFLLKI